MNTASRNVRSVTVEALEPRTLLAATGALDPAFGDGGRIVRAFASPDDDHALAAVFQSDGKLIVAGDVTPADQPRFLVRRFTADGRPDASFGTGGVFRGDQETGRAQAVAVLPNGKILVAGTSYGYQNNDLCLIRLNADGSPDRSFGKDGQAVVRTRYGHTTVAGVVALKDGRVLLAITADYGVAGDPRSAVMLARLTATGTPDRGYGATEVFADVYPGVRELHSLGDANPRFSAARLDGSGRVLVTGSVGGDFLVCRLNADGTDDATFGDAGRIVRDAGRTDDAARDLAVLADGTIVVAGDSGGDLAAIRLAADGRSLVGRFGAGGVTRLDLGAGDQAAAVAVDPDGRLVLVGTTGTGAAARMVAVRLSALGKVDRAFGDRGSARVGGANDRAADGVVDALGRVTVVGTRDAARDAIVAARLTPAGRPDATFGSGGMVAATTSSAAPIFGATAARQADGRTVIAYTVGGHFGGSVGVTRFNADGSLDTSFGNGGTTPLQGVGVPAAFDGPVPVRVVITPAGRIIVPVGGLALAALDAGGRPDPSYGDHGVARLTFPAGRADRMTGITAIALAAGGGLIVAGTSAADETAAFARLTPAGQLDHAFGDDGLLAVSFNPDPTQDHAPFPTRVNALAVQADGRIVAVGEHGERNLDGPNRGGFALVRLTAAGRLDATFGDGGKRVDGFGQYFARATAVAVTPGGRIVVAGNAPDLGYGGWVYGDAHLVVAALRAADGSPDRSFGDGGHAVVDFADGVAIAPVSLAGGGRNALFLARYADDAPTPLDARVDGGVLKVRGSAGDDVIRLRRAPGGAIRIDGLSEPFAAGTFSRVEVLGLAGDDAIDASGVTVPVSIDGGAGDDVLLAGAADDSLLGGAGDDTLFGGKGGDTLRGGDGRDYLNGGPGPDALFGDAGNDQFVSRDAAPDTLDGEPGFDRARADGDDDDLKSLDLLLG